MRFRQAFIALCTAYLATGCAVEADPTPVAGDPSEFRCAGGDGVGAGIIALSTVEIVGSLEVSSPAGGGAIHGNDLVDVAGDVHVDSSIFSAGSIVTHGNSLYVGGEMIEGVGEATAALPYSVAEAAKSNNLNGTLQVKQGNAMVSPVVDGELRLSGQDELTMAPGSYYFVNGMSVSGQTQIVLQGPVKIYVEGKVSFSGTTQTNTGEAYTMEIIQMSDAGVTLSGTSDAQLHIVAPLSDVKLTGTTDFSGTVLGNNVSVSGEATLGLTGDAIAYLDSGGCDREPGTPDGNGGGLPNPGGGGGPGQDGEN